MDVFIVFMWPQPAMVARVVGWCGQQVVVCWMVMWVPSSAAAMIVLVVWSRHATRLDGELYWWAPAGIWVARRVVRSSVLVVWLSASRVTMCPPGQVIVSVCQLVAVVPSAASSWVIAVVASPGGVPTVGWGAAV